MAEQGQVRTAPKLITLPSRPSCTNCIAWSDELVAVAGGEVVHILECTRDDWRHETVRINEFSAAELQIPLASQADFLIGREQSPSTVTALTWSARGLGIHKRPVLAVLTSSHILSIWEYAGKPGSWTRTYIVNEALLKNSSEPDRNSGAAIQAFAWLPPVHFANSGRFGDQFIVAWDLGPFYQQRLNLAPNTTPNKLLAAASGMAGHAFDEIQPQGCNHFRDESDNVHMSRIRLVFKKHAYPLGTQGHFSSMLTVEQEWGRYILSGRVSDFIQPAETNISPADFADAVSEPANQYDQDYKLQGHYAVRWMGVGESPDGSLMAACVTFHPSAGPEYSQPRNEQSTLLVVPTAIDPPANSANTTARDVQLQILQSLTRLAYMDTIGTNTDVKLLRCRRCSHSGAVP